MSDPPADSVTVRLGTAADDERIARLLADAAPGNPKADIDVLRWQYRSEAFGPTVTVVAESGGELVGHYSAISVPLTVDGRPVRTVRGVDIVTAPGHRRRGIFGLVAEHLVDALRAAGVEVVVSTPNDTSRPVLLRQGWAEVGDPRPFALVVDGVALAERSPIPVPVAVGRLAVRALDLARRGSPITAQRVEGLPGELDDLVAATAPVTGVVRSAEWWRWRYLDHPRRPYQLVAVRDGARLTGFAALSVRDDAEGRFVQLLDLVAADPPSARALAAAAADHAIAHRAVAVVGAALSGSGHERLLRGAGMLPVPRRVQPRPIHLLVADLSGRRPALASRRWAFSLGDQDHL